MKKITGIKIAGFALFASALLLSGNPLSVSAMDLSVRGLTLAQASDGPQSRPEVNPKLDNPDNPAMPGRDDSGIRPGTDDATKSRVPSGATAEGRSRCGTLTDTLARRRCLEDLQRR